MQIAVVGAGVVGLCSAWYLTQAGHRVTVFDKGSMEADRCSLGNAGMVVPSHFVPLAAPGMVAQGLKMMAKRDSPFRIKPALDAELARWCGLFMKHCTESHVETCAELLRDLHLESAKLFQDLAQKWDNVFGLANQGVLVVCNTDKGFEHESDTAELARDIGLQAEILSPRELKKVAPRLEINAVGAIHFKDDCHLTPHVFLNTIMFALFEAGVEFHWNAEVDLEALTDANSEFEKVVVAAGVWSGKLAKQLKIDIPLQPGKGMSIAIENPAIVPHIPMLLNEAKVAITPMIGGVRFAGTMELGEWNLEPDMVWFRGMIRSVPGYLEAFATEMDLLEQSSSPDTIWTGLRPCSPDGMPYIGAHSSFPKVVFATGHGMMGLSLAPITGKLVSEAVSGNPGHSLLSPSRFE